MKASRGLRIHPLTQLQQAAVGWLRTFAGDTAGLVRSNEGLWDYLPIIPFPEANTELKIWSFHNDDDIGANRWTSTRDGDGATAPAILEERGGGVTITAGTVAGTSFNSMVAAKKTVQIEVGSDLWFVVRAKSENVSGSATTYEFGFTDGYTNPLSPGNNNFQMQRTNTTLLLTGSVAGVSLGTIVSDLATTHTDDGDFHEYGVHIDTDDAGNSIVRYYEDGELVGTSTPIALPTVVMAPFIAISSYTDTLIVQQVVLIQDDP